MSIKHIETIPMVKHIIETIWYCATVRGDYGLQNFSNTSTTLHCTYKFGLVAINIRLRYVKESVVSKLFSGTWWYELLKYDDISHNSGTDDYRIYGIVYIMM